MVLEYVATGAVDAVIKALGALPEGAAASIAFGTLHGLGYLHQQLQTHCDIKTANILLSPRGEVKLCDLGVSSDDSVNALAAVTPSEGDNDAPGPTYRDWFPPPAEIQETAVTTPPVAAGGVSFAGTPFYMAPEVLLRVSQGPPSDIWCEPQQRPTCSCIVFATAIMHCHQP